MKNVAFYCLLHARGMTVAKLALEIHSSRSHVNEVLLNKPGHGHQTRRKLWDKLTLEEKVALGWITLPDFHVEHCPNAPQPEPHHD